MNSDENGLESSMSYQQSASDKPLPNSLDKLIELMTAQNQLMCQIVEQNEILISELIADSADEPSSGGVFD